MWSGHFFHTAVWTADNTINRATAIVRLSKCKHRCHSSKYTYPLAVWEIVLLTRICWFIYFMTPSILLLLPVTQGYYMLAWSPWEQWPNLRCFHCHRQEPSAWFFHFCPSHHWCRLPGQHTATRTPHAAPRLGPCCCTPAAAGGMQGKPFAGHRCAFLSQTSFRDLGQILLKHIPSSIKYF